MDDLSTGLHVLRVFIGPDGRGGNPLGVYLDGSSIPSADRQEVARELGYSETVFVDEVADGAANVEIFTPGTELPFAGHPTVGTSWLLRQSGRELDRLVCKAGDVVAWEEGEWAWIRARADWVHAMTMVKYATTDEVEELEGPPPGSGSYYAWAWIDEKAGELRSRYFASGFGIREDEATGAAAVVMGDMLGRAVTIRQGVGSELQVRPGPDGTVDVGGRVVVERTPASAE
ncbi:MAG: PhzF family phenazine biosynthesis protein [Candidatus Limnocylindrales bacterium]